MKHRSMTKEQREILNQDLAAIMQSVGDMTTLLNACYGSNDPRVARAEESQAALQRLLWALERQGRTTTVGNAVGSARIPQIVEMTVKSQQ